MITVEELKASRLSGIEKILYDIEKMILYADFQNNRFVTYDTKGLDDRVVEYLLHKIESA